MKWTIGKLVAFFTTFALGIIVTYFMVLQAAKLAEFVPPSVADVEGESLPIANIDFSEPPVFNPNIDYPNHLNVKLLQTGAVHSEEVPYKSGERWLGLFRDGNSYALRWTTIENRRIDDELFDREISTNAPEKSIFLLRGADALQPGAIETVFDDIDGHDPFDLASGKSFGLRGSFWWLAIKDADENGFPKKGTSLVLKQSGYDTEVLRKLPNGCNDCTWRLLWVGDLNRDQSLDFLIDVSDHYNAYEPTLFVSSPGYGYSVYASFRGVGC